MTRVAGLVTACALAACTTDVVPVEHIKHNPRTNAFEMGVTPLDTFANRNRWLGDSAYSPDIEHLRGTNVTIRGGGRLLMNLCAGSYDPDTITREEFYQRGIIEEPRFVTIDYNIEPITGIVKATDHDSLVMLTAFVNFDAVSRFYRDVLGDTSRATSTNARVAYYGEVALGCPLPLGASISLPIGTVDNAVYVGTADMFIVLREAATFVGVELGTNPGVAAHEYGHRMFQQNVYATEKAFALLAAQLGDGAPCYDETPEPIDDVDDCAASGTLMKGMDEGTADILAYSFTGVPDFYFGRSLPPSDDLDETKMRDLSRDPVVERSGAEISSLEVPFYSAEVVRRAASGELQFYRLGTLWSRGFYQSIVDPANGNAPESEEQRVQWARERYAPAIVRALRALGLDLSADFFPPPSFQPTVNVRFDPRQFIARYIEEVSRDSGGVNQHVRNSVCRQMCDRFGEYPFVPHNGLQQQCAGVVGQNDFSLLGVFPCVL